MEGADEADLYASIAKQVKAAGGVAAFTDEQTRAECGLSRREYERLGGTLAYIEPELRQALARGDTGIVRDDVEELLKANGVKLTNNSPAYRKLSFAVLKASLKALEGTKRRQQSEPVDTPPAPAPFVTATSSLADDENGWVKPGHDHSLFPGGSG